MPFFPRRQNGGRNMRLSRLCRAAALGLVIICCLSALPVRSEDYPRPASTTVALKLRQLPDGNAGTLLTIPAGDMVVITGESGNYYIVSYEGNVGYVLKAFLVSTNGFDLPASAPAEENTPSSYPLLYAGSKGDAVKALQSALKELGFYSAAVDGSFGSGTRSAVVAFQQKNGLAQTGTADEDTQKLIYEGKPKNKKGAAVTVKTVSPLEGAPIVSGSRGDKVVKLQERLKELGYYTGSADGVAGSATVSAIKAFQKKNGLKQTGNADADTQALLYSANALSANAAATPVPTAAPTAYPAPTAQPREADFPFETYTISSVNLRKEASAASSRLTTVPKGASILVTEIDGDFLKVIYNGKTGYIMADYAYVPAQYASGKALPEDADARQRYAYLQIGSAGKQVSLIQEALCELGFYSGAADGSYGIATVTAMKAFQKKNSIRQDGEASPETQKLIFEGRPLNSKGKRTEVTVLPDTADVELKSGKKGDQVTDLQKRLQSLGLFTGTLGTVYDSATQSAVKKFQSAHGLTVDGIAGKKTMQLLKLLTDTKAATPTPTANPSFPTATPLTERNVVVLRSGVRGMEVTRLQNRLMELGYYTCIPDGIYDGDEVIAVREFQRRNGLNADGVAGLETQRALYSASAVPVAVITPSPSPSPTPIIAPTAAPVLQPLKKGDQGELVSALQTRLQTLGYYTGVIDGAYGSGTAQAVKWFQRANGLSMDGIAGKMTLNALYVSGSPMPAATPTPTPTPNWKSSGATATPAPAAKLLKTGDTGSEVLSLQRRLVQLGYLNGTDGIYGPVTYNAVVAFQKRNGLTADGVAGSLTLAKLNSSDAVSASGKTVAPAATLKPNNNGASFTPPTASQVQYANWFSVIRPIARTMPDVVIYDPDSGLHFTVHMFSFGKHADCEPPTAADTALLNRVVGENTWTPKYVWVVFPDGQVFIASIHSHGHEVDNTPNNNLNGHICLHFPRIMSEAEATGPYAVSHQKEINWGWELTKAMAQQEQ